MCPLLDRLKGLGSSEGLEPPDPQGLPHNGLWSEALEHHVGFPTFTFVYPNSDHLTFYTIWFPRKLADGYHHMKEKHIFS